MNVPDDWYLSPIEWRRTRAELAALTRHSRTISQLRQKHYRFFLTKVGYDQFAMIEKHMAAVEQVVNEKRKLIPKAKLNAQEEFLQFVEDWRKERDDLRVELSRARRLMAAAHRKIKTEATFRRIDKIQEEMTKARPLIVRMRKREQLLLDAIAAGLFLTTRDLEELQKREVIADTDVTRLLQKRNTFRERT